MMMMMIRRGCKLVTSEPDVFVGFFFFLRGYGIERNEEREAAKY